MTGPAVSVDAWRARGRMHATPDGGVFTVRAGSGEQVVLLLHGFPTSSWDFAPVVDALAVQRTVLAFDFLGYGLSDKPKDLAYSLFEQADVATCVLRAEAVPRVHVVAHDMGTSVATELLARRERGVLPFEIQSLTLMNGSVHIEMASLTLGQHVLKSRLGGIFAKWSNRATFKAQMRRIFARPARDEDLDAMWELLARDGGALLMPRLIGYVAERSRFARRWVGALERLDLPALVAWGALDPVAVLAIAQQLAREIPGAQFTVWKDLGHYPQVEDPARVAAEIARFLTSAEG